MFFLMCWLITIFKDNIVQVFFLAIFSPVVRLKRNATRIEYFNVKSPEAIAICVSTHKNINLLEEILNTLVECAMKV